MPLIDNTNPPRFDIPGTSFTGLAAPSRGTRENAVWRTVVAPGTIGAPHHLTREEIVLAVKGHGAIHVDGVRHPLASDDVFAVPAFSEIRLECAGDTPFEAIVVLPAGAHAVVAGKPSFQPPWSV